MNHDQDKEAKCEEGLIRASNVIDMKEELIKL